MGDLGEFPQGGESTHVLKLLDAATRCSICYAIFDAPLFLRGCGHSFCSACIRQNLGFQEKTGDPQCPSCRAPCDARDLQPNVSLRELAEKYSGARSEIIRLVVQENEQKQSAAKAAAEAVVQAAPAKKKARKEDLPVIDVDKKNIESAPRRSSRRSAVGRAKEAAAKLTIVEDDSLPGPSTRSTRTRAQAKAETPKKKPQKEELLDEECIEILSDKEEEEEQEKDSDEEKTEKERSVDHDADFDLTMDEESIEEDDEEFSPSPPLKKQKQQPPAAGGSKPAAAGGGAASTPQGFVPCPICGKSVPSFYINSHVDSCLNSSGGGVASGSGGFGSEEQEDPTNNNNHPSTSAVPAPAPAHISTTTAAAATHLKSNLAPKPTTITEPQGAYIPLAVPPMLVPSLASDKIIRTALKKHHLPTEGKKSEMFDRYSQFRTAVLTANDRQERTSYMKIAQKMAAQERQRAAAALLGGGGSGKCGVGSISKAGAGGGVFKHGGNSSKPNSSLGNTNSKKRTGDPTVLQGDSFEELIAVTKARDAARRAARAAAAAAAEEEEIQEGKAKEGEKAVAVYVNTTAEGEEETEQRQPSGEKMPPLAVEEDPRAADPALPNIAREEMLAEEVRQANEIGLLDSDDDNW